MRKRNLLACMLAGLSLLSACSQEQGGRPQMAPEVAVVTLEPESVTLTRELPGRTSPFKVAEVRPQVNGLVEQQLFREGGMVEADQPLYQLDDATYRADHESARAGLQSARAELEVARLRAERVANLVKTGAVSKQENDSARADLKKAEAAVASARAAVRRSRIPVDYARISAPIAGRIGKSSVTQGALVTANQATALVTIQQLDPIYVDLNQSTSELLSLRRALEAGQVEDTTDLPVTILLEDGSTFEHKGKLEFAEATVDPTTGSVLLRVVVPNPDHMLLPGMYVRAVVGRGLRDNAILVPQQGVTRDPKGNTNAMVVNSDNKVEVRPLTVSQTIGSHWLVEDGLQAGDRVIVEGLQKVRPGVQVTTVSAETEQPARAVEAATEADS
ncbi:efflux RND transporter periplasmic adaptor subunit [Microbulbifer yueqingensis]|uniref:Membrane fusion protein, multidrug efflux system n=1 Tax=Microbulbifer yueqingensis TaxID=658219 RepID=A0A1G8ZW34_9GAMM|nr:efflux RND transporter periplasmic adaptor subunit [Microbulbifer yueqingensis]SDK19263.1 membrane fusion protein, multidrug efflux system [Microbulbifer yueqingensis]